MRKPVQSDRAPASRGAYSQGIVAAGRFVFLSGQLPFDPETGAVRTGEFHEQAALVFEHLGHLLAAAGSGWAHVVKLGVFLADLRDYAALNEVSARYLVAPYPARTLAPAALPPGVALEIDCIALVPDEAP